MKRVPRNRSTPWRLLSGREDDDELEERIWESMREIEGRGGFIECFKAGWIESELNQARYRLAEKMETAELPIIGLNSSRDDEAAHEIKLFQAGTRHCRRNGSNT